MAKKQSNGEETTQVTLSRSMLYQGTSYGPGEDVEVPADAAEDFEAADERASEGPASSGRRFNPVPGGGPVEDEGGVVTERTDEEALQQPDTDEEYEDSDEESGQGQQEA